MEYPSTTHRLTDSRMIKVALIGVATLMLVQAAAYGFALWVTRQIVLMAPEATVKITALQRIAELLLGVSAIGAIGTIITAVIARYGAREATRNIGEGMAAKETK